MRKITKRAVACFLVLLMVLLMMPVMAFADDGPVAKIGDENYATLADAVTAAQNGDTIKLLTDVEQTNSIIIDKNIGLELNGKKITVASTWGGASPTKQALFYVKSGGKLTVNDSVGEGEINSSNNADVYAAITLTIGGSGNNDTTNDAELVINGGLIKGYYYGIVTHGERHNTKITINGGTITGADEDDATSIYHPSRGKLIINGGKLIGYDGIAIKGGTPVLITGGEFIATGTKLVPDNPASSGCNSVGSALYVEGNYGYGACVTIKGGKFRTTDSAAPAILSMFNTETNPTISITGGYYSDCLMKDYIADGYYCINTPITDPNHVDYPYMIGTSDVDEGFNKKSTADVPKGAEEGVADAVKEEALREIVNNTAVTEKGATNINDEDIQKALDEIIEQMVKYSSYLQITVKSVETKTEEKKVSAIKASTITTTSAKYDVKPYVTVTVDGKTKTEEISNTQLAAALAKDPDFKITFRLAIPESMKGDYVAVSHYPDGKDKADWTKEYKVLGKGANRYVELSATSFSVYEVAQTTHKNPETGNNNNVGLFVGLGGLSLLGIIALAVLMLKKKSYR